MPALTPQRLLLAPVFCLASCIPINRYVYRANPINLPGQLEKGESRVTVAAGGNAVIGPPDGLGGVDVQAAYAVSDRVTLLGGVSNRSGNQSGRNDYPPLFSPQTRDTNDESYLHYRNDTWELGLAYNFHFRRRVGLSLAAGGGGGSYRIDDHGALHDTLYNAYLHTRLLQWFIQPAMVFKAKKVIELGVGVRLSSSSYSRLSTSYPDDRQHAFDVNALQGNTLFMIQPFWWMTLRPHLPWLQIHMQMSINAGGPNTSPGPGDNYSYYWLNGGVGVTVDPIRLFTKL